MGGAAAVFRTFCPSSMRPFARVLENMSSHRCTVYAFTADMDGFSCSLPVHFGHSLGCPVPRIPVKNDAGKLRRLFWSHFARAGHDFLVAPSGFDALCAMPMAQHFHLPVVTRLSGHDLTWLFRRHGPDPEAARYAARWRELLEGTTLFLVPGFPCRELLLDLGCPKDRIAVFDSGVCIPPLRTPVFHRLPIILVRQPLEAGSGLFTVVRAFEWLMEAGGKAHLWIVGEGSLKKDLRETIRNSSARESIFLYGSGEWGEEIWDHAEIVLVPPVVSPGFLFDSTGTSILYGSAHGRPVVATAHGGSMDRVADQVTGLIVPERDPGAMADALLVLLKDPEMRARFGRAGRAKMELEYSVEVITPRLEHFFSQAVAMAR